MSNIMSKDFKLINTVTLTEEATRFGITTDSEGKPFKLTEWYIEVGCYNKNEQNTNDPGWKVLRVILNYYGTSAIGAQSVSGIDGNLGNLPNYNANLFIKAVGKIIDLDDTDSKQHSLVYKSIYDNFSGQSLIYSKVGRLKKKYVESVLVATGTNPGTWLFGVGSYIKLYGK